MTTRHSNNNSLFCARGGEKQAPNEDNGISPFNALIQSYLLGLRSVAAPLNLVVVSNLDSCLNRTAYQKVRQGMVARWLDLYSTIALTLTLYMELDDVQLFPAPIMLI